MTGIAVVSGDIDALSLVPAADRLPEAVRNGWIVGSERLINGMGR
ncbi:hypothetical protein [Saccharopolyspora shandongensis]